MKTGQTIAREMLVCLIGEEPLENHRPSWLLGLEIDLYWPKYRLAVEFQGGQHYLPVFGKDNLHRQIDNDRKKMAILDTLGIHLIRIHACHLKSSYLMECLRIAKRRLGVQVALYRPNMHSLKRLDAEARRYRKYLIREFSDPTARFNAATRRKQRTEWYAKNGYPLRAIIKNPHLAPKIPKSEKSEKLAAAVQRLKDNQPATGGVVIDNHVLEAIKSESGGYTKAALIALGVGYPAYSKWRKRIKGIRISQEAYEAAIAARNWTSEIKD